MGRFLWMRGLSLVFGVGSRGGRGSLASPFSLVQNSQCTCAASKMKMKKERKEKFVFLGYRRRTKQITENKEKRNCLYMSIH